MREGESNRLARETSPYLLQHAKNPVDWYPWGPEALERAKREDRPIFLSVGYSACHWCHVMERECFESPTVAELMNRWFVNVKVDREERPDVDDIYMKAVQAITGQGGWPMSVFLTPDLEPFFGGTYFPPEDRYGRPGFSSVLRSIAQLWERDRQRATQQGRALADAIAAEGRVRLAGELDPAVLDRSLEALAARFDPAWGGFGSAPKFPHTQDLRLALRHHLRTGNPLARTMAVHSLERMACGGIYDHLGGGFCRYSTDERWLIPHFEKMLYDSALLVPAYLEAFLVTGAEGHGRVARETCDWMLREMQTPEGGFASSLDADSEGEEGKFYVWTPGDLRAVLGAGRAARAQRWYGVVDGGNFEHGTSALWRPEPDEALAQELEVPLDELRREMEAVRAELFAARATRIPPGKDDKVLAAWNGLAISALASAYQVLDDTRYLDAARGAARYVLDGMRQPDGRLFATARAGRAHLNGYLDDYAFVIAGLLDLYESDFDPGWLRSALELDEVLRDRFEDPDEGGYFATARDHERLIARLKNTHDGALPAGNSVQALNLLRLAELGGDQAHAARAERTMRSVAQLANQHPVVFSQMWLAVDFLQAGPREIVLAGDPAGTPFRELLRTVRRTFLPQRVVAHAGQGADVELMPLLEGKASTEARAFVCRNYTCSMPSRTAAELAVALR